MKWCDCCGDRCLITFPLEVKLWDGRKVIKSICIECADEGAKLEIDLKRIQLIARLYDNLKRGIKS